MMTTYQGGTVILMEKFEAENALRLIERYRVTHSQWVPIMFSGDHVRFNYHREPDKTAEAYDDRGWATTGDLGYLDEEGFLYLTGRESFTIEHRGEKVYPQEMENILVSHSKIDDVAVFGIPIGEHGEEIKVVIQPRNWSDATDQTAAEIMTWLELEQRVACNSMPHSIDFHPNLPRMDNGKLYKRQLLAEYMEPALQAAPRTG